MIFRPRNRMVRWIEFEGNNVARLSIDSIRVENKTTVSDVDGLDIYF